MWPRFFATLAETFVFVNDECTATFVGSAAVGGCEQVMGAPPMELAWMCFLVTIAVDCCGASRSCSCLQILALIAAVDATLTDFRGEPFYKVLIARCLPALTDCTSVA